MYDANVETRQPLIAREKIPPKDCPAKKSSIKRCGGSTTKCRRKSGYQPCLSKLFEEATHFPFNARDRLGKLSVLFGHIVGGGQGRGLLKSLGAIGKSFVGWHCKF